MWMRWAGYRLECLLLELLLAQLLGERGGWVIAVLVVLQGLRRDEVLPIGIVLLDRGIQEGILQVVVLVRSRSGADQ